MSAPGWSELFRGRTAAFTLSLNLGIGLHAIDVFVITTVMPAVVRDIGGAAFYAWPTMLYMVASIVGAATGGPVRAALGARIGYLAAAAVFLVGSVGCAVAPTMAALLVARTVQGAGGGVLIALSMALVQALYPPEVRPRLLSTISTMWGIAAVLGPLVGGGFSELGWWRGAFWFGVPVILVFSTLAWVFLPRAQAAATVPRVPLRRLGLLGGGVLSVGVSGNVAAVWLQAALLVLALVLVAETFRRDRGASAPLFPSRPLNLGHPVGVGYWIFLAVSLTHSPIGVFMPLVVQVLHGGSPLLAGYFNTFFALSWTAAALASSGLVGPVVRGVIVVGPLVLAGGVAGLALTAVDGTLPQMAAFMVACGLGIGMCHAHITNLAMSAARAGEESLTASSIPTIRSLGIAFGAAAAGLVANAAGLAGGVSEANVAAAARWVFGLAVLAPAATAVLAWRFVWLARRRAAARPPGA